MEISIGLAFIIIYALIYIALNILVPKSINKSAEYAETMGIALSSSVITIIIYDYSKLYEKEKIFLSICLLLVFIVFTFISYYEKKNGSLIPYEKIIKKYPKIDFLEERRFSPKIQKIIDFTNILILNIIPAITIALLFNVVIQEKEEINIFLDYKVIIGLFIVLIILKFIQVQFKRK